MSKQTWVKDFTGEEIVCTSLIVLERELRPFVSKEGEFLQLVLADKTGEIDGICWNPELMSVDIVKGDVLEVKGTVRQHREYGLQLIFNPADVSKVQNYQLADYLRSTDKDIGQLTHEIFQTIEAIENRHLRTLLKAVFNDENFYSQFSKVPATLLYNQNYLGGLLEHTVNVVRICKTALRNYPGLDKELVLAGALLSNIGKTREYQISTVPDVTEEGGLVGHFILNDRILNEKIDVIKDFPEELKLKLKHLVVARSKKSGMPPKFPEAVLLSRAMLLDAQLNGFIIEHEELSRAGEPWAFNKNKGYYFYTR